MTEIIDKSAVTEITHELRIKFSSFFVFFLLSILSMPLLSQSATGVSPDPIINNPFETKNVQDFNFATAGDFGCDANAKETIASMTKKAPELVIALGDLSYSKTADCWFGAVESLDNNGRLKISVGEHDLDHSLTLYKAYLKHFSLVKPFYSFDVQNVHFLAMATGKNRIIPYNTSSEQYRFVEDDLRRAHTDENIDWIIVYQFRSFYSSLSVHPGLDALQETYHPLFEKYGVDLVLQAHNHNYQRTYPLAYNESSSSHPIIADHRTNNYDSDSRGPIFLTVGTGGESLHGFLGKAPFVVTQFANYGFLNVDLIENGRKLVSTFYDNVNGGLKDQFTITK